MKRVCIGLAVFGLILGNGLPAQATGFRIGAQGGSAIGQGLAFTAQADDPTAIYYNPAGLTEVKGTQTVLGTSLISISNEFTNPLGLREEDRNKLNFPSHLYLSTNQGTGPFTLGLGVFTPFGLSIRWSDTGIARYNSTRAELITVDANPTVAYRVSPQVSLAVGLNVVYADAKIERMVPITVAPGVTVDRQLSVKADDTGTGFNLGVQLRPSDQVRIGLTYRSEVKYVMRGTAQLLGVTTPANTHIAFKLPSVVTAGIAYRVNPQLTLEADVDWVDWSTFRSLQLVTDNPLLNNTIPRNWKDAYSLRVGGNYRLDDHWTLRAGYYFDTSPVPDTTLDPMLPDADRHVLAAGFGYRLRQWSLDVGYLIQFLQERTVSGSINTPPSNGTYDSTIHVLTASVGYRF